MPPAAPGRAGGTRSLSPAPRDVPGRAPAPRSAASRRESPGKEPGVPGMLAGCGTGVCGCAGGHNSPRVPSLPLGAGCQAAGPSAQTCPVLASPQPGGAGGWQGRGAAPRPSPLAPGRPAEHGERCSSAWLKEGLRGFPVALQSCWETSLGGSPAPAPAWDCFRSLLQGHRAPAVPTPPPHKQCRLHLCGCLSLRLLATPQLLKQFQKKRFWLKRLHGRTKTTVL